VDELTAVPAGKPVLVPPSSSTFSRLSWTQGLIIVVGSSAGAALLATVVFIVVVSVFLFFLQSLTLLGDFTV